MAIFEKEVVNKVTLDDTEPITCIIENWRDTKGYTEFIIRAHRGPFTNHTWQVVKRYNDFVKLHAALQESGIPLCLPPKRILGNRAPEFIAGRQQSLQKYLNIVLMNPILVSSLPARSFVDPANYCQPFSEQALQHVSLALRGEIGWEIVGPLPDVGWRLRKHFYHVKSKNLAKDELWANWVDYGPDKYLDDKEMLAVIKSLNQLQHPFIQPIVLSLCTDVGGLFVRACNKGGSMRDALCGASAKQSFMKKYGNPKGHKPLEVALVALYGRQILEALKFLHDKGLPYGHLHTGNLVVEGGRVKLLDVENGILGVPGFYRPYFMQHKKINTLEAIDVYCFGHTVYEMAFGAPLHESVIDALPADAAPELKSVLESILSAEGCKMGVPSIESLLKHQFFASVVLTLASADRALLKIPNSAKEHLKTICGRLEDRLKEEQKIMRSQKRLTRVQEMMSSEEEKKKQRQRLRQEQKQQARVRVRQKTFDDKDKEKEEKEKPKVSERSESATSSSTANSMDMPTPPTLSGPSPPPPPPPPPPAVGPMPSAGAATPDASSERAALLGSICSFNRDALRKTKEVHN